MNDDAISAILLAVGAIGLIILTQPPSAVVAVGAGYEGYTKYVKPQGITPARPRGITAAKPKPKVGAGYEGYTKYAKPAITPTTAVKARQLALARARNIALARRNRIIILKRILNAKIQAAAIRVRQRLIQQQQSGTYRPVQYGGGAGNVFGGQLPGTAHGGTGVGIPPVGDIVESIKNGILGRVGNETPEQWVAKKAKECNNDQACENNQMRVYNEKIEQATNATEAQLSARGGSRKGGLPGVDPTQAMA